MTRVCAFTSICREDICWIRQYITEAERLGMDFIVHFDRCKVGLTQEERTAIFDMFTHPLCVGWSRQDNPRIEFNEQHKQVPLDKLVKLKKYDWAMAWDIDETYETRFLDRLPNVLEYHQSADLINIRWLNLWNDREHIRTDLNFLEGHRVKFYNLQEGRRWIFDHPITNGAKLVGREGITVKSDLVCLHHGMMTQEMRELHKARWDRIYSTALKGDLNPYGFWKQACDTSIKPKLVRHGY